MNFLEIMKSRYTTKKYDATKKISSTQINELKQILNLSPSSINSQPWKFIFVENNDMKDKLAEVSYFNKEKVLHCSHLVVFNAVSDIAYFEKQIAEHLPEGPVNYYRNFIKQKPEHEVFAWLQHQVYISLGVFLSACAAMGIDATPMEGIMTEKYTELLKLKHHQTVFAVCIGGRDAEDSNQPNKSPKKRMSEMLNIEEIV